LNLTASLILGLLPVAGALSAFVTPVQTRHAAQKANTPAARMQAQVRSRLPSPPPGSIVFNDPSPKPSGHDLSASNYVGFQVCAGCHGRLTSTRPDHTIIQEWDSPGTFAHAKDPAVLDDGATNVFASHVRDGLPVFDSHGNRVAKQCGVCHSVGAPKYNEPQDGKHNGFDASRDWFFMTPATPGGTAVDPDTWAVHKHNMPLMRVQCENCHGPGSQHVLSGGDPRFIDRVPEPKQTCWNCHVHTPQEKGNILTHAVSDAEIAMYTLSHADTMSPGSLIAGTGGYEYPGEDYSGGHKQAHTRIRTTCVTCHLFRNPGSPILNHADPDPKIAACRSCHGDARNVSDPAVWSYVTTRQAAVEALLIQLGGANPDGSPDGDAGGGLLGAFPDKTSMKHHRARWNHCLVLNDGSLGVHNFDYAIELLTTSIADLQKPGP
jgi:hypothetical protein